MEKRKVRGGVGDEEGEGGGVERGGRGGDGEEEGEGGGDGEEGGGGGGDGEEEGEGGGRRRGGRGWLRQAVNCRWCRDGGEG